jgi:hypothetical protein
MASRHNEGNCGTHWELSGHIGMGTRNRIRVLGFGLHTLPTARAGKHWARAQLAAKHHTFHRPFYWIYVNWTLESFYFRFFRRRGSGRKLKQVKMGGKGIRLYLSNRLPMAGTYSFRQPFVPYDQVPFASKHHFNVHRAFFHTASSSSSC